MCYKSVLFDFAINVSGLQRVEQINELKSNLYEANFWADLTFVRSCEEENRLFII
jgi:hypothetical protein